MWGSEADGGAQAPQWHVGDKWVYARSGTLGEDLVYEREVTAVFMQDSNLVYELKSGLRGDPLQDFHLYRTDDLRFVASDLREAGHLLKRVSAQEPLVFHYVFPLEPGERIEREGVLEQKVSGHQQTDRVTVTATVDDPQERVLGERTYRVIPYEIRIQYETTPFEDEIVLQAWWAPTVAQNVVTVLHEGGETVRHELLYFERREPESGPPAYDLVPPLETRRLERGFEARLSQGGWERYLFHVEDPVRVGVSVSTPDPSGPVDRLDVVSLRPLGFTRAGVTERLTDLATGGLFLHVSALQGGQAVHHHAAQGTENDMVILQPGQVYELVVASDQGSVNVRVEYTSESQDFAPVQDGGVEVLSSEHVHVDESTDPGPQSVSDYLEVRIDNPEGERVEGVVYVADRGDGEDTLMEMDARREVRLFVDGWAWKDEKELYAYYFGYVPRDGFQLRTGFEYQATLAIQASVDYEMGVLLLRLLPP